MSRRPGRLSFVALGWLAACTMPNPAFDARDELADATGEDPIPGDGDGDSTAGDGDPTAGDGDPAPTTGDGDGDPDPTAGDGDGDPDPTAGDGDGDPNGCDVGLEACGDTCVDLDFDNLNCGGCGNTCEATELCGFGQCNRKRHVFVSTHLFSGAAAASSEAATKCTALAQDAGLPGSYRGWISDNAQVPALDFADDPAVFLRSDGWAVAWSWAELVSGALIVPINLDQNGMPIPPSEVACNGVALDFAVWTGTTNAGLPAESNCENWAVETLTTQGVVGYAQSGELWSDAGCSAPCASLLPVYCIEE